MGKRLNGEGSIIKRKVTRKDGSSYFRYLARVTTSFDGATQTRQDGPWRKTGDEARTDLKKMLAEMDSGGFRAEATQTLRAYLTAWLDRVAKTKKFRTYQTYHQDLSNHVIPRLGQRRLKDLSRLDVQNMVDDVYDQVRAEAQRRRLEAEANGKPVKGSKNPGAAVARKVRGALKKALQDAVDLEILFRNPCHGVKVPAESVSEISVWSKAETERFLEVARAHRLYPILYTALTSGMREGELCALRWDDLEILEPAGEGEEPELIIHIRRGLVRVPTKYQNTPSVAKMTHVWGVYYFDEPKTKGSKGSVVVGFDTLQVLLEHKTALAERAKKLGARWHDFNLVFPASTGVPQSPRNLLRDYRKVIAKAGIAELTIHDLRDTHASRALAEGYDIAMVSERLRHSRKSTTLDRYAHVVETSRRRRAIKMSDLYRS
jgi:integrase